MIFKEGNRKALAAAGKCVLAALWAAPFIQHGSTKRASSATNAAYAVDGGAGRPALSDVQANGVQDGAVDGGRKGISVGRDVPVAPSANATSNAVWLAGSALRDGLVAQSADAAATATAADTQERVPPESGGRFRTTQHSASNDLARPDGAELFDRWRLRGAADDAFRIAPHGWWLRLPDGFADGVTVFSRGEIRPDARTAYFPPIFTNRVSILPQSRWHLIGANGGAGRPALPDVQANGIQDGAVDGGREGISVGRDVPVAPSGAAASRAVRSAGCAPRDGLVAPTAESGVWHALTPSNSLLVGWANAALGRNPSTPTNAVVELFRDGRFAYRYADCTAERSPILLFDLDDDGLENSVDPDPLVAGRDAHGTNAEWYLSVCSNVFEVAHENVEGETAHGDARPSADANGVLIPDGVAWRDGVNTNAYYFVDVVAERGPAPVYFVADRESRLGSPVVVALADETNRVPLLMGVKYAVTSEVPISVSVPADAELDAAGRDAPPCRSCISITRRSQSECGVEWPIGFTFTEAVSGSERTYSVGVVPYDPGGDFEWGGNGGVATMSLASSASCRCASGDGRTLSFACSMGCPCSGGCSVSGRYSLEGAYFAVTGGVCRCGFDDGETPSSCWCGEGGFCPCGETCYCNERNEGPYLSVSFSRKAVIFEETYENSPGELMPRRSTRTTLSVAANGGPRGGRLTLDAKNLDRFAAVVNGPLCLPPSTTLGPFETYSAEFICEARTESDGADDVKVDGEFVEDETGDTIKKGAALTVVRVELLAIGIAPENECHSRHVYGVDEDVRCISHPAQSKVEWKSIGLGTVVSPFSGSEERLYTCPISAEKNGLMVELGTAKYIPQIEVKEPTGIKCEDCQFAGNDLLTGVGMELKLHVLPYSVNFENLELQEVAAPANATSPDWGVHTGFFSNFAYSQQWYHYATWGAGRWVSVGEENRWGVYDSSRMYSWSRPWFDGRLTWVIPIAWRSGRTSSTSEQRRMKTMYTSEWTMTEDAVVKEKHGMKLTLTESGMVFLNDEHMGRVDEDGNIE